MRKTYFTLYADKFKLMRLELSDAELLDMLMALSDLCLWGECEYDPQTPKQKYFWEQIRAKYDEDLACYKASVENGKKGGRPTKLKPKQNSEENPNHNPDNNLEETQSETQITNNKQQITSITSQDKSCLVINNSSDEPSKYAFEGKIVKLNQKNFDEWKKAYPNLNLYAELLQRDRWLQKQPEDVHKNWFMSTSQYFIKQDALRKAQNSELADQYGQQKASNDDGCWF